MVIVGNNTNTAGELPITVSDRTGGFVDWKTYANLFPKYRYPTADGSSPVSNALAESVVNVLFPYRIEKVIFHDPATIVIWKDKTKTVVKCHNEPYDREKGLAMCIAKKVFGDKFHSTFREWCGDGGQDG